MQELAALVDRNRHKGISMTAASKLPVGAVFACCLFAPLLTCSSRNVETAFWCHQGDQLRADMQPDGRDHRP